MPSKMPRVYEGDRDYIFVSYAHADTNVAMSIIDALVDEGYRVWYDNGTGPATDYSEYIADHVYRCACFIMLVSHSSVNSEWCLREVNYALELRKRVLPIFLEDVEPTRGLHFRFAYIQWMSRSHYESNEAFYKELFKTRMLDSCLTPEGVRRRQAKRGFAELHELLMNDEGVKSSETYGKTAFAVYPSSGLRSDL